MDRIPALADVFDEEDLVVSVELPRCSDRSFKNAQVPTRESRMNDSFLFCGWIEGSESLVLD